MYKTTLLVAGGLAAAVLWFATPTQVQAGGYYHDEQGYSRYHYNPPVSQTCGYNNSWVGSNAYRDGYHSRRVATYRHSNHRGNYQYNRYNQNSHYRRGGWYGNNRCD